MPPWFPKSDVVSACACMVRSRLLFILPSSNPETPEIKVVYVERVSKALERLHVEDERAHLDVRFENI